MTVGGARGIRGQPEGRHDLLALLVERVRRGAQDVDRVAIDEERPVLVEEPIDLLRPELQDLGPHERRRFGQLGFQHVRLRRSSNPSGEPVSSAQSLSAYTASRA